MKKVNIQLDYKLSTDCPHCGEQIYLEDDDDAVLSLALFGKPGTPADWENLGVEWVCPECGKEFEIGDIEY